MIVQLPPAETDAGQLFVCEKSPASTPAIVMLEMFSETFWRFVNTVLIGLLDVPTDTVPKFSDPGANVTGLTPFPFTEMVWGLLLALSETVTVLEIAPVAVGEKETMILHDPPAGIDVPQVLTWLNGAGALTLILVRAAL